MGESTQTGQIKSPLILVDGSSYLFRAYHALPKLTNSDQHPTGAIRGVLSMLMKLQNEYQPSHMAVVFDAKGKTFRHDMYDQYKAHRPPMPEELAVQIQPLHDMIRALGLPLVVCPGVEADDVIGTLARQSVEQGASVLISTGDKDLAQLVTDKVALINTMKDEQLDPAGVKEKFGVSPERIIDYLALLGDKSDNIPGLPGVGEKTARALLEHIQDVPTLLADPDAVADLALRGAKSLPKKIREFAGQLELSRQLVTIDCQVDLSSNTGGVHCLSTVSSLAVQNQDQERLKQFYETFEFRAWLQALGSTSDATQATSQESVEYDVVTQMPELEQWIARLLSSELIALDTETTGLDYMSAELVGLSFAVKEGEACYIPLAHTGPEVEHQLPLDLVLEKLSPVFTSEAIKKVGQNLKFDISILARYGVTLSGVAFDTMLESYVWNSTGSRHDMDTLAQLYLGKTTVKFEDIAGKGAKQITFDKVPLTQAAHYAAEDADITLALHQALWKKIDVEPKLKALFDQVELPLVSVLSNIERTGALLDVEALRSQSASLAKRLGELTEEIYALAGQPFNIDSPKQLGEILFEKLKLPVIKKTPKGAPSTAEPVLQELAQDFPMPERLLEYRSLNKLKNTYTDKLPELIHPKTGRVHTSYHQAVTATGRLSSSDPNLQNIPIRTQEGKKIRHAFIAPEGSVIVACDYSQIELRIMAHLSKDKGLLKAFVQGEDIHKATAADVLGIELDAVTDAQRRDAKAINFGLIYGMSAFGLARQLGVARNVAQSYIDAYFARYPGVKAYMDTTRELAKEKGFVETLLGRRLYLPEINAKNKMRQQAAERTAINAPMQGTAADIIKLAMIDIHRWLASESLQSKMILQVHDELVLEVPENEVELILKKVPEHMSGVMSLDVPLVVDTGVGQNWGEAH